MPKSRRIPTPIQLDLFPRKPVKKWPHGNGKLHLHWMVVETKKLDRELKEILTK